MLDTFVGCLSVMLSTCLIDVLHVWLSCLLRACYCMSTSHFVRKLDTIVTCLYATLSDCLIQLLHVCLLNCLNALCIFECLCPKLSDYFKHLVMLSASLISLLHVCHHLLDKFIECLPHISSACLTSLLMSAFVSVCTVTKSHRAVGLIRCEQWIFTLANMILFIRHIWRLL